ncbi:hypothetical protein [Streptomyces sp. 5-6(2022)]|uniref:hypothetical protein n=1 Tax=Streptomyces sp. 5-6(2022) TaxID=2936510 RepID=UPI0023B93D4C|nr:hypothetical protein [Streptomyces sp. 5-6(2022)]
MSLAFRVDEALADLPEDGRQEVMETIAKVLVRRDGWFVIGCGPLPAYGALSGV